MADDNGAAKPRVVVVGKQSVNMALDLLRSTSKNSGKRKRNADPNSSEKISSHCHSNLIEKKGPSVGQLFSKNQAITEMRTCLARRDWTSLRQLLLMTLSCNKNDIEPIIWRYALTLLVASPYSDTECFQQFLKLCIGEQTLEDSFLLERLLALQIHKKT